MTKIPFNNFFSFMKFTWDTDFLAQWASFESSIHIRLPYVLITNQVITCFHGP